MKLPNGFGSVIKLSGKRRKPYGARVTVGWENGKQVRKYIGYFATSAEAVNALSAYNVDPFDITGRKMTVLDVWEKWRTTPEYKNAREGTKKSWQTGFKHCEPIYYKSIAEIKVGHLESLLEGKGVGTQTTIKNSCSKLFKYALKHEWVDRNPVPQVTIDRTGETKRVKNIFTEEEIKDIWNKSKKDDFFELLLILLYTGMRINELLTIRQVNVHDDYMIGGNKTPSGRDRLIPLHKKIRKFVKKRLDGREYLVHREDGKVMDYQDFYKRFKEEFGDAHTIHETRHTFISRMHSVGVNEITIKMIVGHAMDDVTSKVYIHKQKDELLKAVHKLV